MRIGIGHDVHRLRRGRKLLLGGVRIPHARGLVGHSDGDVVLHALMDAVLGAMGEGDIGDWFPDHADSTRGISSGRLFERVKKRLAERKMRIANIDTIIHAQAPHLGPYKSRIRESLARIASVPADRINVKAKTAEGLGAVGEGRALEATCVVLLEKKRGGRS